MSKLTEYIVSIEDKNTGELMQGSYFAESQIIAAVLYAFNNVNFELDDAIDRSDWEFEDFRIEMLEEYNCIITIEEA